MRAHNFTKLGTSAAKLSGDREGEKTFPKGGEGHALIGHGPSEYKVGGRRSSPRWIKLKVPTSPLRVVFVASDVM